MLVRVVAAFIFCCDHVLIHKHKKAGMWMGFGGHVDDGETELDAVVREVCEETGLNVSKYLAEKEIDSNRFDLTLPNYQVVMDIGDGNRMLNSTYVIYLDNETLPEIKTESPEIEKRWIHRKSPHLIHSLPMFSDTRKHLNELLIGKDGRYVRSLKELAEETNRATYESIKRHCEGRGC